MTGCLPVALDKATRIVQTLLIAGKEYIGVMHLHEEVPVKDIETNFKEFVGKILQLPPRKSAVKRQLREREIYYLTILEIDGQDILFKMGCQAGTYVRKFCSDFGKKLNIGAHMAELIRTKAGPFKIQDSFTLLDLKDAFTLYKNDNDETQIRKIVLPMEKAVDHLNKIWVNNKTVNNLCHGADLFSPGVVKLHNTIDKNEVVAIMSLKDELICLSETELNFENILTKEKGLIAKTKKVFMERNTYK